MGEFESNFKTIFFKEESFEFDDEESIVKFVRKKLFNAVWFKYKIVYSEGFILFYSLEGDLLYSLLCAKIHNIYIDKNEDSFIMVISYR